MSIIDTNTPGGHVAFRHAAMQQLLRQREQQGFLSTAQVLDAANRAGVSKATMWRWVKAGQVPARAADRYEVGDDEIHALRNARGNMAHAARNIKRANGNEGPSVRTIRRTLSKAVPRMVRETMRTGHDALHGTELRRRFEADHRNEIWEGDHKELSLRVLYKGEIVSPWATLLLDSKSRAIVGHYLTPGRPTADSTMLCLLDAIGVADEEAVGGVPEAIRWDNDPTFTADAITEFLANLGCDARPVDAYKPNHKGKIERFNRTVELQFSSAQPGYVHGPRELNGDLYDRSDVLLAWVELLDRFDEFITTYNAEHQHQGLRNRTPLSVWEADPHPITTVPRGELLTLLPSIRRTVGTDGIHDQTLIYWDRSLRPGDKVEIRRIPGDERRIEVYRDGEWFCSAVPQNRVDEKQTELFFLERGRMQASIHRDLRRVSGSGEVVGSIPRHKTPAPVTEADIRLANAQVVELLRKDSGATDTEPATQLPISADEDSEVA